VVLDSNGAYGVHGLGKFAREPQLVDCAWPLQHRHSHGGMVGLSRLHPAAQQPHSTQPRRCDRCGRAPRNDYINNGRKAIKNQAFCATDLY